MTFSGYVLLFVCGCVTVGISGQVGLNCPQLMCGISCPFGYETDSDNCPRCRCAVDVMARDLVESRFCPGQWPCLFLCPDGYLSDPTGCYNCACRPGPGMQSGCGPVGCTLLCNVTGYLRASNGCPVCQCRGQCDPPSCPSFCPVGFISKKDPNGCDVCYCASCPLLNCLLQCPNNAYDYDPVSGCRRCQCRENTGPCPRLNCDMRCLDGYQVDPNTQCPICLCEPDPSGRTCPRIECVTQCPGGQYARDTNGCQTCTCLSQCTPLLGCNLINCPAGLVTDTRGCQQCKCSARDQNNPLCVPSNCALPCAYEENGLQKDQNNCDICACADSQCPLLAPGCNWINCPQGLDRLSNNNCPICTCTRQPGQICAPSLCDRTCLNGFQKDTNNCDLCQCRNSQCAALPDCNFVNCPSGLLQDSQGCDICSCRDPQNQSCPPVRCPVSCTFGYATDPSTQCQTCVCQQPTTCPALLATCGFTNCPGGLMVDNSGCQSCQCRSHPDESCQPQPCALASQCRYGLAKQSNGCETCRCFEPSSGCPELPTSCTILNCPGGFVTNNQGCPQCQCTTSPGQSQTCSPITCPSRCPFGYQQDARGCLVCVCNQPGQALDCLVISPGCTCPAQASPLVDSKGCRTCDCTIFPCQGIPILLNCRAKTCDKNQNGCWSCNCFYPETNAMCRQTPCYTFCITGYVRDQSGCETCECRGLASNVVCPEVKNCIEACPNGRKRHVNGCEICTCNPVSCPPLQCRQTCRLGRKLDSSGCPTCSCICQLPHCSLQCPLGLKVDSEGCAECVCRESSDAAVDFTVMPCRQSPEMLNCAGGKYCDENQQECIECSCFTESRTEGCEDRVTECRLKCPAGYERDENDCEVCRCRGSICPIFQCAPCTYGYMVDAQGCPRCECRTTPCPQLTCPSNPVCSAGYALDSQGCPTCNCKPTGQVCRSPVCLNSCPHNIFVTDSNGCTTCQCRCTIQCGNSCPNDYIYDSTGCPTCECVEFQCPDVSQCRVTCAEGFQLDAITGCRLCACRQPATCQRPVSCPPDLVCHNGLSSDAGCLTCVCSRCVPFTSCDLECLNGLAQDVNGCDICECRECPPLDCPLTCPGGDLRKDVTTGCDVCACAATPQCPVFTCSESCRLGFKTDGDGCPECECRSCPRRACYVECQGRGKTLDEDGCEQCHCATEGLPDLCRNSLNRLRECKAWCLYGYRSDLDGCPVCQCSSPRPVSNSRGPCPTLDSTTCPRRCRYGYQSERNGCALCECQGQLTDLEPGDCGPLNCPLRCTNGLRLNTQTKCPFCECN